MFVRYLRVYIQLDCIGHPRLPLHRIASISTLHLTLSESPFTRSFVSIPVSIASLPISDRNVFPHFNVYLLLMRRDAISSMNSLWSQAKQKKHDKYSFTFYLMCANGPTNGNNNNKKRPQRQTECISFDLVVFFVCIWFGKLLTF